MRKAIIYILHTSLIKENYSCVLSILDKKRRDKAERCINEKDRLLSLGAGYLLKKFLPPKEIQKTENGKPYLDEGPFFNLSHSEEYVVLAIHEDFDVGVDIERINEKKVGAIKYILSDEEKDIEDINTLFRIWSNKESVIKCISTGLKDIRNVNGLPLEGLRTINGKEYFTKSMIYEDYSLSITLNAKEQFDVEINQVNDLKI